MNLVKFQATHGIVSNAPQTIMVVADDPVLIPRLFHGVGAPSDTTLNAGNGRYNAADSGFIIAATLLDRGSGYAANDVLTLLTGTASQTLQITVDEVDSAGAILNYHVSRCGIYSVYPDLFPGCTGGTGSGAAFTPALPPADQYLDETDPDNPALYVCKTAGNATTSVWKKISGGSGGFNFKGKYDKTASYAIGDLVLVEPWDSICTSGAYDIEQSLNHLALTTAYSMPGFYVCLSAVAPGTYSGTPAYYVPQQPPVQSTHANGDPYVYNDAKAYWLLIQPYPTQQYVIRTLSNADYYVANTWDGTYIGTQDVYIAKDPRQRPSVSSELIDGVSISYSSYTSDNSRTASDGTNSENQVVFPRFQQHAGTPGGTGPDNLSVVSAHVPWLGTGVSASGQPIFLQEIKPARVWAKRYA